MDLTLADFHTDEKTEDGIRDDADERGYRLREERGEHKVIRRISGSFVIVLLVKPQIRPARYETHAEQPWVSAGHSAENIDYDREHENQNRNVAIA